MSKIHIFFDKNALEVICLVFFQWNLPFCLFSPFTKSSIFVIFCVSVLMFFFSLTSNTFRYSHNCFEFIALLSKVLKKHVRKYICLFQCLLIILKIQICRITEKKILKNIFPEQEATRAPSSVYCRGCSMLHCAWLWLLFYYRAVNTSQYVISSVKLLYLYMYVCTRSTRGCRQ